MAEGYRIGYPPDFVFENFRTLEEDLVNQDNAMVLPSSRAPEFPEEGGILTHPDGALYPKKGFVFPEAMVAANIAKKVFITQLSTFSSKVGFLGLSTVLFLPWRWKVRLLTSWMEGYNHSAGYLLGRMFFKEQYLSPMPREMKNLLCQFTCALGVPYPVGQRFAKIWAHIFQHDNGYSLPAQDILNEVDREALIRNPRREIRRLIALFVARDKGVGVREKFASLASLLSLALLHPRVRYAFVKAVRWTKWEKLGFDEADAYHALPWSNYDVGGFSHGIRWAKWRELHGGNLPKFVAATTIAHG